MMFWYDHDLSGWGWFAMSIGMILFWALIITAVFLLFRALSRPQEPARTPASTTPEQILGDRFARGDIDEEEYRRRMNALRTGPLTKP